MQFVAQRKIVVAMLPQEQAGKAKSAARLSGSGIMGPKVGWEKPGPTERFSSRDRIDQDRFSILRFPFQNDGSGLDKIKTAGRFAFAQNELAALKLSRRYTKSQKLDMVWTHSLKKGMCCQPALRFPDNGRNAVRLSVCRLRFQPVARFSSHPSKSLSAKDRLKCGSGGCGRTPQSAEPERGETRVRP